jgi:hypothetical protein
VKSVNAEHYHRIRFRQFTRPLLHALRVAPDRAFDDVLRTGYVVPRTRIKAKEASHLRQKFSCQNRGDEPALARQPHFAKFNAR